MCRFRFPKESQFRFTGYFNEVKELIHFEELPFSIHVCWGIDSPLRRTHADADARRFCIHPQHRSDRIEFFSFSRPGCLSKVYQFLYSLGITRFSSLGLKLKQIGVSGWFCGFVTLLLLLAPLSSSLFTCRRSQQANECPAVIIIKIV